MELKLQVPTKLNEINLAKYQEYLKVANSNDDPEFIQQKMIQIFCGIDLKNIAQIMRKDVNEISESIGKMFTDTHNFLPRFKLNNIEFGFIPNLEEITNGEYIDITKYISNWDEMHKAMAVMFRPINQKAFGKYEIEPYINSATYSEVMKFAPLDVVLGAVVFFYNLANELLKATLNYLENNQEVRNILQRHNSIKNGDGIAQSMLLLKEMLLEFEMQQDFHFLKA